MYSGNAVVVNFVMRFPILVPVAVAVGIVVFVPKEVATPPATSVATTVLVPPSASVATTVLVPPPLLVLPKIIPAIETLCPHVDQTSKLHTREKQALIARGCKVKG